MLLSHYHVRLHSRPLLECSDNRDSSANIDGSAWMAQRRAKMEQEAKEQKQKEAERLQQEQDEKQSRRKSQLNALKAAMSELKQEQVDEVSQKEELKPPGGVETNKSNVRILKKKTAASVTSKFDDDDKNSSSQGKSSSKPGMPQNERNNFNQKHDTKMKGSWRRARAPSNPSVTASKTSSLTTQPPPPPKYN